jgi:hypothetical protein
MEKKDKYFSMEVQGKKVLDEETGELEKMYAKIRIGSQEEFLKIYFNSIDDLANIDHTTFQVLLIVLKRSKFCEKEDVYGNEFFNNDTFKAEVKEKLGLKKDNTVNKYVSNLAKAKILLRVNKGSYILNPRYFARGTMTAKTRLELIVQYNG